MSDQVLLQGDSLELLKDFPDNSVDAVVTDPPYGLSFMGKKWDYDVPSVELWKEVLRVLKPGGHVLSFGGTRTYHRMVVNMEDAGFEIRDQVQWLYGSGFPKSHNLEGDFKGWGTALKPANEPICLSRKPLEPKLTVAANVLKYGTGGLNIDASRVGSGNPKPVRIATAALPSNGKYGEGLNGSKAVADSTEGRWPANLLLDEDAAAALDEQTGITTSSNSVRKNKASDSIGTFKTNARETSGHSDFGGASRFFYVAKASKKERGEGNNHPTVKPIKLMEYLISMITPPGGVVLDPFMGSGTTGVAAKNLGFGFIGIEREEQYHAIAEKRMAGAK